MARFIHMRQRLKLLSYVLFIPFIYVSSQSCALDLAAKKSNKGHVYLEKKIENNGWRVIAWVVLDGGGKVSYKFNQYIADKSGNNLTIKKHGSKEILCCSQKLMISSFFIKENDRRKSAKFEIKVMYQGKNLGNDVLNIRFK